MTLSGNDNLLGVYLRARRTRLDPAALGFPSARRRTPGLRREEVAQRANVSATWYTWLEQGRGGAPSTDVLDRLSRALTLTEAEREHLYLLALRRPPEVRLEAAEGVTPRLQRVLDAMDVCPALVKNSIWDVVAWNVAAARILTDYGALPPEQRNMLRLLFTEPRIRETFGDWQNKARFVVAVFRADTARAGASKRAEKLVAELCELSPEFAALWHDNDVQTQGEGTKHLNHPVGGPLTLDYQSFTVDGQPDLTMMIFTPATPADADRVRAVIASHPARPAGEAS